MAFTIKIQSPNYKTGTSGSTISLPVVADTYRGNSMAAMLSGFKKINAILDFAQLREIITLVGVLTDQNAVDAAAQIGGAAQTIQNAVHYRDVLMNIRGGTVPWPIEAASSAETWATGITDASEQDAGTTRLLGKTRLIYEKRWDVAGAAFINLFVYGTLVDITFGPRAAATGRTRIPYALTFMAGDVKSEA